MQLSEMTMAVENGNKVYMTLPLTECVRMLQAYKLMLNWEEAHSVPNSCKEKECREGIMHIDGAISAIAVSLEMQRGDKKDN